MRSTAFKCSTYVVSNIKCLILKRRQLLFPIQQISILDIYFTIIKNTTFTKSIKIIILIYVIGLPTSMGRLNESVHFQLCIPGQPETSRKLICSSSPDIATAVILTLSCRKATVYVAGIVFLRLTGLRCNEF